MEMYEQAEASRELQTDEQLVGLVTAGDTEAFGILVERYEDKLLRYGRRFLWRTEDIEDIVQDVFIRAYQNIQGFDRAQRFSPWIYRIAHNAFVDVLKKRSRNPLTFIGFDFDTLIPHASYDDPAEREREQASLRKELDLVLGKIPPAYAEVLALYYFEDLSYKDIAEVLRVPPGTVGIRLSRARTAMKKAYEKLILSHGT
jgi:RNA polymerase sigma-70 factor (ECF subfamily)